MIDEEQESMERGKPIKRKKKSKKVKEPAKMGKSKMCLIL